MAGSTESMSFCMLRRSVLAWLAPAPPASRPSTTDANAAARTWKTMEVAPFPRGWRMRQPHGPGKGNVARENRAPSLHRPDVRHAEPALGRVGRVGQLLEAGEREARLRLERRELGACERPGDA